MKRISFVIPCYRSEMTIRRVIDELVETVSQREEYTYEIICINDCSPDGVYGELEKIAAENRNVKVINFTKNMGKYAALMAGYAQVSGEYVVTLDDDFQCPGYELWKLVDPVNNDMCDVATALYPVKKQAAWKNFGSNVNVLMGEILLDQPRDLRFENFMAMKRFVADEIVKYTNPYPYIEGLILRVTRNIVAVEMEERERGDSNTTGFTFVKSLALWFNGFTAFSVKPLRISTLMGMLTAALGFLYGLIMIIQKILDPSVVMGYTSLVVILLFLGGMILMCLGLMGEYIGRIYICMNNAPQYVIRNTINFDEETEANVRG